MEYGFITFRSVTVAQRGERVLQKEGISCALRRTPKWMAEQGCSYCLRLRSRELDRGVAVLQRNNVPISKVYGEWEEGL